MKRSTLALLALAACSTADIEPKSGTWTYNGSMLASNSCGADPPTEAAGNFTITVTGDGVFTVKVPDFAEPFDCTYDGDEYNCPERLADSNKPVETVDATLFYDASIKGTLVSDTEVTGTQTVNLRCEGASCAIAADLVMVTLPCAYSYTFTASAQ